MSESAWMMSDQERTELLVAAAESARAAGANGTAPMIADEAMQRLTNHLAGERLLDANGRLRWVRRTARNLAFSQGGC